MQVSSKTSMSNAIFHNLESGSNELQSGFSEFQLKLIEKADTQHYNSEPRGVQHAPRILRLFIRPPANFRQSFARRVIKNRDFFWYSEIFLSIRGGSQGASSGFGRLGQNPAGAITKVVRPTEGNKGFIPGGGGGT